MLSSYLYCHQTWHQSRFVFGSFWGSVLVLFVGRVHIVLKIFGISPVFSSEDFWINPILSQEDFWVQSCVFSLDIFGINLGLSLEEFWDQSCFVLRIFLGSVPFFFGRFLETLIPVFSLISLHI